MQQHLLSLLLRFFKAWQLSQTGQEVPELYELADEIQEIIDDKG